MKRTLFLILLLTLLMGITSLIWANPAEAQLQRSEIEQQQRLNVGPKPQPIIDIQSPITVEAMVASEQLRPDVLWSQMSPSGGLASSQDFEAGYDAYDAQGADDFIVTDGPWTVGIVKFHGGYWNGTGPAEGINIYFYENAAGIPGNLITSYMNLPYTDTTGLFRVVLPEPHPEFADGQYWISIQGRMDFALGGQFGWAPHATPQVELERHWRNPGGGFGPYTNWTAGSIVWPDNLERDFTFQLETPPEAPELSVSPATVNFGISTVSATKTREVTLTNSGGGTLQIAAIGFALGTDTQFTITGLPTFPLSLSGGENATFYVHYTPTLFEENSGNIVINDNRLETYIPLTGEGGIFGENFDGLAFPPNDWTQTQLGAGTDWARYTPGALGTPGAAVHNFDPTTDPMSWLITPAIQVPLLRDDIMVLSFYERNQYVPDWYGFSGVYISSGSGVAGHEDFELFYESSFNTPAWTGMIFDISEYAGETIYIAFVYSGLDAHDWWIDQVEIYAAEAYYLTMLEQEGPGDVWPPAGVYGYLAGGTANLIASPYLSFQNWIGNVADPNAMETTITINQDETIQAIFDYDLDLLWHQFYEGGTAATSVQDGVTVYEIADNFGVLTTDITKIVVHGLAITYDGGWIPWTPGATEPFNVRFYPDPTTEPAWGTVTPILVNGTFTDLGQIWGAYTHYMVELDLPTPVNMTQGWVSVQINVDAGAGGWFLLLSATYSYGDGYSFQNGSTEPLLEYDIMLELWGLAMIPELDIPVVNIIIDNGNAILSWDPVEGANSYYIYVTDDPYLENWGLPIGHESWPGYTDLNINEQALRFYKVVASTDIVGSPAPASRRRSPEATGSSR